MAVWNSMLDVARGYAFVEDLQASRAERERTEWQRADQSAAFQKSPRGVAAFALDPETGRSTRRSRRTRFSS